MGGNPAASLPAGPPAFRSEKMKTKRIHFSTWGENPDSLDIASYAVVHVDDDGYFDAKLDAVKRSIERTTGLAICGCTPQGQACSNGVPESSHYQITLGRPVSRRYGGGYSVEGGLWVSIPCETGE